MDGVKRVYNTPRGAEDVLAQLSGAKALKLIDGNLVTEDTDEWTPKRGSCSPSTGSKPHSGPGCLDHLRLRRGIDRFANWFVERARSIEAGVHSGGAELLGGKDTCACKETHGSDGTERAKGGDAQCD